MPASIPALPGLDFEQFFAALPTPFAVLTPTGEVQALNTALAELLPPAVAAGLPGQPLAALWQALAATGAALPTLPALVAGLAAAVRHKATQVLAPATAPLPPAPHWQATLQPVPEADDQPVRLLLLRLLDVAAQARALSAAEQRTQRILDQLPLTVSTIEGEDLCFTFLSATARERMGPRAAVGRPVAECLPEVAAQGYTGLLRQVRDSGRPHLGYEERSELLDPATGTLRETFYNYGFLPLLGSQGAATGVLTYGFDVTAEVQARRALETTEAAATAHARQLARLVESLVSIPFIMQADLHLVYLGPQWYAYTGTSATTDSPDWQPHMHPDDVARVLDEVQAALAQGRAWSHEFRLRRADGAYRWFTSQGNPEPAAEAEAAGRPRQWFGSAHDIDALQQAQQALETKDQQLREILHQSPAMIAALSGPEHRFAFTNPGYDALVGHRARLGASVVECFPEVAEQGFVTLLDEVYQTGLPHVGHEKPIVFQPPGSPAVAAYFLDFTYQPLRNGTGQVVGILAFVVDVTERVLARQRAEALQATTARQAQDLKALTDSVPSFVYELRADGTIIYLNAAFFEYVGLPANTPPAATWDKLHPADVPAAQASFAAAVAAEAPWEAQFRVWHAASATYRWSQTRARPRRAADQPDALTYSGVTVEIQALREAQDALARREEQLHVLTESIPQLVWTVEADGRNSYVNQRYTDYTGLTLGQLQTEGWGGIIHPDELVLTQEMFARQLALGAGMTLETRMCRTGTDGPYRWFLHRADPQYDAQGRFVRWFGTSTDVQEQHELQERLLHNEAELRIQAESLPQQIWTAQPDGSIDFYNHRTVAYLGFMPDMADPGSWLETLHPDDRPLTSERWRAALAGGRYYEAEFRLRRYDGQYRWFLAQAQARRTPDGTVLRWYGTNTDIEDQKRSQRLLVEQNTRLKRSNRDLDNFVYTASHDLKQPVTNMGGIFEELRRTATFHDPEAPRLLAMFERALAQIYATIDDLGAIVQVQRPASGQEMEPVELPALADEILASLRDQATRLRAEIRVNFTACPTVRAVRSSLQSVFFNLLGNALKYADPARPPRIRVSSAPDPTTGHAVFTIADNGRGLDLAKVGPQLFQQFSRFHPDVEGSGMGLYLVNRIVEASGGRIAVTSALGVGTTFTVYWGE